MIEAQKKEYIERDAAKKEFLHAPMTEDEKILAIRRINSVPAADVVEVVHAYWIQIDQTKCKCSRCKVITLIAQYPHGDKNYCPNCGAKMDGGEHE